MAEKRPKVYMAFFFEADQSVRYCKIGITGEWQRRIKEISTSNPLPFVGAYFIRTQNMKQAALIEQSAHTYFDKYHQSNEWFKFNADDISAEKQLTAFHTFTEKMLGAVGVQEEWFFTPA